MRKRMIFWCAAVIGIAFAVMTMVPAYADQHRKGQERVVFTLDQCIEHAVKVSPEYHR